jgi:hypothetical protein
MGEIGLSGEDFAADAADAAQTLARALGDLLTVRANALAARDTLRWASPYGVARQALLILEGASMAEIDAVPAAYSDLTWPQNTPPYDLYCMGWENGFRMGAQSRDDGTVTRSEREAMLDDLGELLVLLDLGDFARPESPHEVFRQCLEKVTLLVGDAARAAA